MNRALEAYLADRKLDLDPEVFEEHIRDMNEQVIPQIVEDIHEGERLAADLRYAPAAATRRAK